MPTSLGFQAPCSHLGRTPGQAIRRILSRLTLVPSQALGALLAARRPPTWRHLARSLLNAVMAARAPLTTRRYHGSREPDGCWGLMSYI